MLATSAFPVFRRSPWPKWLRLSGLHGAEGRWVILEGVKPMAPATSDERNHGVASGCAARELLMLMLFLIMLMMMMLLILLVMVMMMMMIQYYGTLVLAANMVFSSIIGKYVYKIYIYIYTYVYIYIFILYIYIYNKYIFIWISQSYCWWELSQT